MAAIMTTTLRFVSTASIDFVLRASVSDAVRTTLRGLPAEFTEQQFMAEFAEWFVPGPKEKFVEVTS